MGTILVPAGLLTALVGVGLFWLQSLRRQRVRSRLEPPAEAEDSVDLEQVTTALPFARRHHLWVGLAGVAVVVLFAWGLRCPLPLACGLGLIAGLVGRELDAWVLEYRHGKIEMQLADTIDLLVAAVGAGSSLQTALARAAEYAPSPLREELSDLVARLRLGDFPAEVFRRFANRIPLETFRLFALTLSVNWEAGGTLTETLSAVGMTIRDRVAVARQFRALSTQGRLTTGVVLSITWFMAAMMWQSDPARFTRFLLSPTGIWLVTVCLVLQGFGITLVSRISRPTI